MSYTKNKYIDFCKKINEKYPNEELEVLQYTGAKEEGIILCKNNNYILIEIEYFNYNNIENILNKWLND